MKLNKLSIAMLGLYVVSSCGSHTDESAIREQKKHQTTGHHHDSEEHDSENHEHTDEHEHAEKTAIPTPMMGESAYYVMGSENYDKMVEFYSVLGWEEKMSGEEPWKWSAMFDGSTMLMINEDTMSYFAFGYYSVHGDEVYSKLEALDVPTFMTFPNENGEDWFKVYNSPDSMSFTITNEPGQPMETQNAGDMWADPLNSKIGFPNPVVGTFQELALTVEDINVSMDYWKKLGFETHGIQQSMYQYTHMYDGLVILGLHETKGMWHGFTFTYSGHGVAENEAALAKLQEAGFAEGVTPMEYGGEAYLGNYLIPDPAGNMFMLTTDLTSLKK